MRLQFLRSESIVALAFGVAVAGCAANPAPATDGPPNVPKVGWVIMQGSADNPDEEFVCQSTTPRGACEITASRNSKQVFSEVHLYFHPVDTTVRYEGSAGVDFLGPGKSLQLDVPVKADGDVGNHSVVGIVTDKAGTYSLNIAVGATTPGGPSQIREQVPVIVK